MQAKGNKRSIMKWVAAGIALAVLVVGGYFGFRYYQNYQANKVYSVGETVSLPDFKLDITKAEFKPVDLPLDKKSIAKYGDLEKHENCDTKSKASTWNMTEGQWYNSGPSDYNVCIRRNDSRDTINEYTKANNQLVVHYKVAALNNVDTSKLKIELIPSSGRNLGEQVNAFNANQFFPNGDQHKIDVPGAPGAVYADATYYSSGEFHTFTDPYKPYHMSDIGNYINKDLERAGYIYTDIRKSENSVDMKITYRSSTRIVRITR